MIYLLVGVPASGKTWVTDQLKDKFCLVPHDEYIGKDYVEAIVEARMHTDKPILCETPFSVRKITNELNALGYEVTPVFIIEDEDTLRQRWAERGTDISARLGHLSRQCTYVHRAHFNGTFLGNSEQVLEHLKNIET
jgi:hypothetical protein